MLGELITQLCRDTTNRLLISEERLLGPIQGEPEAAKAKGRTLCTSELNL